MLETGEARDAGPLHHLCKSVEREGCDVGADVGVTRVQFLKDFRLIVIVLAARFEVKLPAVARDGHLHDLGGAFVNRGDAHVALDLLHHVFVRVAIAAEGLDAGVGCAVTGFGGVLLGILCVLDGGTISSTSTWQPSRQLELTLTNITALVGTNAVSFRFTPTGYGAAWQIDDVYLDPFKST